ncbi:hypothetical protein L484_023436 [Morus notabilis]|uniref:Uncharacterized protein n=1 Tax=Morus notabilis TaxID=981085 RepID=W9RDK1_9ROSA|nr:hypothetical protein L484_023436 [Morus notabilis]
MWAASYVSPPRLGIHVIPKPATTLRSRSNLSFAVSAGLRAANDVGGEGRTTPRQKQKPKQEDSNEEEEEGKQISGSDVLWALRKAAAKKNKLSGQHKNKKKKKNSGGLSSSAGHGEEIAADYSNVRPLLVKSEWSGKFYELEKRLRDLSHTK